MGLRLAAALRRALRITSSTRLAVLVLVALPAVLLVVMLTETGASSATTETPVHLVAPTLTPTDSLAHHYVLTGSGCTAGHITAAVAPTSGAKAAATLPKVAAQPDGLGNWSSPLVFASDVPRVPLTISARCEGKNGGVAYPAVAFDLAAQLCQAGLAESITAAVKPGDSVPMTGCFDPNENVIVTIDGGSAPVAILLADSQGLASVAVALPATIGAGAHTLTATGQTSHLTSDEPFTVASAANSVSGVDAITITATPVPLAAVTNPSNVITSSSPLTTGLAGAQRLLLSACLLLAGAGIALAYVRTKHHTADGKIR